MGLAARYAALGSALDSTEELWHPSPMQSGGRQYAPQLTRPLRRPAARADVPLKEEAKPPISLVVVLGLRGKSPQRSKLEECEVLSIEKPRQSRIFELMDKRKLQRGAAASFAIDG